MAYAYQKQVLTKLYGSRCMLCERTLQKKYRTYHHIIPKSISNDNKYTNGCILCEQCQQIIHTFEYGEEGYTKLTNKILKHMQKYKRK